MSFPSLSVLRGSVSEAEPALKKLRNRLISVNLISLTLVIAVAFSVIYVAFYHQVQNEIDQTMRAMPRGVLENLVMSQQESAAPSPAQSGLDGRITISGGPRIPVDYTKSFVANIDAEGRITVFSMIELSTDDYAQAVETATAESVPSGIVTIAGRAWKYNVDRAEEAADGIHLRTASYGTSIVFLDVEDTKRRLGGLALTLFAIGVIAVWVILFVSLLVANRAIRPVSESMARQRRFVADASHELKTPIAVIAANAEAAKGVAEPERWIDNIADEATRMSGLVENLLALAKAEEKKPVFAPFELIAAVCEESDRIEAYLFEKKVAFDFEVRIPQGETLFVRSDAGKVKAVLSVLLENAVKYTPDGGRVTVTICGGGVAGTSVSISNTGAYIPPESLEHIFDRFYRADRSHNSETGGHGIGLSIAKAITDSLGGSLSATSEPPALSASAQELPTAVNTFTFTLPA